MIHFKMIQALRQLDLDTGSITDGARYCFDISSEEYELDTRYAFKAELVYQISNTGSKTVTVRILDINRGRLAAFMVISPDQVSGSICTGQIIDAVENLMNELKMVIADRKRFLADYCT